jgi:sugar phosphate isomerase/epimerase
MPVPKAETMPFAFGVSQFTTMPWDFEHDIARYAALGVEAIEVCEQKLDMVRGDEQMALIAASGMKVCAVQPVVRTFFASRMQAEPAALEDRVASLRRSIQRLARFAPGAPFIVNTGAHPKGDMAEAMAIAARELKALAPFVADHGVTIALEPLNPTSVNVESAIWTVDQALDIIEATGREEIGLCLDYWNIWQNLNLEAQIRRAAGRLFSVQASDWRTPRSFADRIIPGDGPIPLGPLMRATYEAGFRGACTVEIFSLDVADSLYDTDMDDMIRRSRTGLETAWSAARSA